MIKYTTLLFTLGLLLSCNVEPIKTDKSTDLTTDVSVSEKAEQPIAIVLHGGAGAIRKENMPDTLEQQYLIVLDSAISLGYKMLEQGGDAIDVVTTIIQLFEDSPLFNAGKGAVFTHDETNELDASIMMGDDLNAGAVAGVRNIKNPILLAKEVMLNSEHVMMSGTGAEEFASQRGLEKVDPSYFSVQSRLESLKRVKARSAKKAQHKTSFYDSSIKNDKFGTVGCVALDQKGNIVAGTSTGGMTNKRWGRIGDSPIIGAGTYANNNTCGVSSTGWGEYFIRGVVAYDISAMMEYGARSLSEASSMVIHEKLPALGGDGGIIALDKNGNISMEFNTDGMYRAGINGSGEKVIAIYKPELD